MHANSRIGKFFVIVLAAFLALSACSKSETPAGDAGSTAETSESAAAEEQRIEPDLPEVTYDGAEFWLMQWYRGENHMHNYFEYFAEVQTGEILIDTIYSRNRTVEEKYDIKIRADGEELPSAACVKLLNAGDFKYHFCADIPQRLTQNSLNGGFYELDSVPYLDISMPWWNSRAQEGFSVGGKLYLITGDYVLYEKQRIFGMFFNRDMAAQYNLENPYQTAADGKWTVELLAKYAQDTASDLNGDGTMFYDDDQYGLLSGSFTYISAMLFGMGNRISAKDTDDLPVLALDSPKLSDSIDRLGSVIFTDRTVWGEVITDNWSKGGSPAYVFESGRALFYFEVLHVARTMDTDIAYGIIPLPKYDEAQADYLTTVQYGNSGAIAIPANNPEIEMTGVLLEALAAESHYTTLPVFIETVLKTKKAPDELAPAMLDVIFKGIVYDIAEAFDFGGVTQLLNNELYKAQANNFSSKLASRETAIQSDLEKTIEAYTNIPNS